MAESTSLTMPHCFAVQIEKVAVETLLDVGNILWIFYDCLCSPIPDKITLQYVNVQSPPKESIHFCQAEYSKLRGAR